MKGIYTKKKLFEKYYYLPEGEMRAVINEIIASNRKLPLAVAKFKKYLRPNEVKEFLNNYDIL